MTGTDLLKTDLHIHALSHRYYPVEPQRAAQLALTAQDRADIEAVVDWCAGPRGLGQMALAEHDLLAPALYAQEYASRRGYAMQVVPCAECEVRDTEAPPGWEKIHLLCLGLERLPPYTHATAVAEMAAMVHEAGGRVVMAHPVMYPQTFLRAARFLDGYERNSGRTPTFHPQGRHDLPGTSNPTPYDFSDFHYKGEFPSVHAPHLWSTAMLQLSR